jgi:nicotinamide mononucleotide (NMN) deamidase PncC
LSGSGHILEQTSALARQVHGADGKICLVVSGAGSQAVAALFAEPGASRTMLDAQVPYSSSAMSEYSGHVAQQHVSAEEAARLAEAALRRARKLAGPSDTALAGISCTAAITTDRIRRGENRCHVSIATSAGLRKTYSLVMSKGERDRAGEEAVCSAMVLNAVAEAKGIEDRLPLGLLPGEHVVERMGG